MSFVPTTLEAAAGENAFTAHRLPRILWVEDDAAIRELFTEFLTRRGYQVDTAEDGEAGWDKIHNGGFDLLITDNSMPKLSGVGLVKKVRAAQIKIPIIMASGTPPPDSTLLGIAAVLPKPFTASELSRVIEEVLHPLTPDLN